MIRIINAEDIQEALDSLKGSTDPRSCIEKLYEEIVPTSEQKGAIEKLLREKKIRTALTPEIHIQFVKYQLADSMGYTSEKELSIFEENIRKALGTSKDWKSFI